MKTSIFIKKIKNNNFYILMPLCFAFLLTTLIALNVNVSVSYAEILKSKNLILKPSNTKKLTRPQLTVPPIKAEQKNKKTAYKIYTKKRKNLKIPTPKPYMAIKKHLESKSGFATKFLEKKKQEAATKLLEKQKQEAAVRLLEQQKQEAAAKLLEQQKQEAAAKLLEQQKQEAAAKLLEQQKQEAAAKLLEQQKQEAATKLLEQQKQEAAAKLLEQQKQEATAKLLEQQKQEAAAKLLEQQKQEAAAKLLEQQKQEAAAKPTPKLIEESNELATGDLSFLSHKTKIDDNIADDMRQGTKTTSEKTIKLDSLSADKTIQTKEELALSVKTIHIPKPKASFIPAPIKANIKTAKYKRKNDSFTLPKVRLKAKDIMPPPLAATVASVENSPLVAPKIKSSFDPSDIVLQKTLLFIPAVTKVQDSHRESLDSAIRFLKKKRYLRLQLQSFASTKDGSKSSARRASLSRAISVRDYLVSNGVKQTRIHVRALGEDKNEKPHNRVEILFLK